MEMFNTPEEYAEYVNQQQTEYEMNIEVTRNEYIDLVRQLNADQLTVMRKMMISCHEKTQRGTLVGIITGALTLVHGRTWDGEDPMKQLYKESGPSLDESKKIADNPESSFNRDDPHWHPTEEQQEQAERHEIEWNTDPNFPNQWRCKNCEQPVSSLKDRMLRAPGVEGCPTCQHKMKWG